MPSTTIQLEFILDTAFIKSHIRTILILVALSIQVIAILIVLFNQKAVDYSNVVLQTFTTVEGVEKLEESSGEVFVCKDSKGTAIGFSTITDGQGFSGSTSVGILWDLDGKITELHVVGHHDDINWWNMLEAKQYFDQYIGRSFTQIFQLGQDIDAVTGATYSSDGVATAVREARFLVSEALGDPIPRETQPIHFGHKEIIVLAAILGVVIIRRFALTGKWIRYSSLAFSFGIFGVWLVIPLSIGNIIAWALGFPPNIHTQLYMYFLVIGIIGLAFLFSKNYYCYWLCPFSAVQEIMHQLGKVSIKPSQKIFRILHSARYFFLWLAVLFAVISNNASVSNFEPWGTLFSLKGSVVQWVLLAAILLSALIVRNIWCCYLCPVGACLDLILEVRKWINRMGTVVTKSKKSPIKRVLRPTS